MAAKLKNKNAPDIDKITNEKIKLMDCTLLTKLQIYFNKMIEEKN